MQMVMAVFAYIYHQSFVMPQSFSVEMILDQVYYLLLIFLISMPHFWALNQRLIGDGL